MGCGRLSLPCVDQVTRDTEVPKTPPFLHLPRFKEITMLFRQCAQSLVPILRVLFFFDLWNSLLTHILWLGCMPLV